MSPSGNADKVLSFVTHTAAALYGVLHIFRSNSRTFVTLLLGILSFLGFKPLPVLGLEVITSPVAALCRDVIAESAARGGELRTQLYWLKQVGPNRSLGLGRQLFWSLNHPLI